MMLTLHGQVREQVKKKAMEGSSPN